MIVTIDGPAGSGKSSVAKRLAEFFGFVYLDTGAMYRGIAYLSQKFSISVDDEAKLGEVIDNTEFQFYNGGKALKLRNKTNNEVEDVTEVIRSVSVSKLVSSVASKPVVRRKLSDKQREFVYGENWQKSDAKPLNDAIMDGRDSGTVVFPEAQVKFFLTASVEVRALRRANELHAKKVEISMDEIKADIEKRDHEDVTRKDAPLRKAEDAILVDNSAINAEETFILLRNIIKERMIVVQ